MKLTTLSRYAVRSLFDIAYYGNGDSVKASQVSKRQKISRNYIGQIFLKLKRGGLIKSQRGRSGGYVLGHPPEEITLLMIVEAVEGEICLVSCLKEESNCDLYEECVTREVWEEACKNLQNHFSKISIASLIDRAEEKGLSREAS